MDTPEQYIKMCAALPADFWEGWQDKEGDIIAVMDYSYRGKKPQKLEPVVISKVSRDFDEREFSVTNLKTLNSSAWYEIKDVVRLPRLDQLQELSGQKWDDFFQNCIDWKTDLDAFELKTSEQAGLIMIMYEEYEMIWTGEKWEKGEY